MSILDSLSLPLVSLALPVYNGEKFVDDAITSILMQDYKNLELTITDNASTDSTERICRDFAASDNRIRYYRNEKNLGAGPNFNLGFQLSSGKYFKWCAADDRISPNFVSTCVEVLEMNSDAVLAYGTTQSIDVNGNIIPLIGREMTQLHSGDSLVRRFYKDLVDRVTCTNFQAFSLIRSSALRKTDLHRSYYGSDQTLVAELVLFGKFAYVPQAILYNREHSDRSINIRGKEACLRWQDTSARNKPRTINYRYRLRHVIDIAIRHRKSIPFFQMVFVIILWTLKIFRDRLATSLQQLRSFAALKPIP